MHPICGNVANIQYATTNTVFCVTGIYAQDMHTSIEFVIA